MTIHKIDGTVLPFIYMDDFAETDRAFVCATWANSLFESIKQGANSQNAQFPPRYIKRYFNDIIQAVLFYPSTQIKLFRLKDDPTSILSYAIYDTTEKVLHYTYTKFEYRQGSLACNLCLGKGLEYYSLETGMKLPSFMCHLKYHPYFLYGVVQAYGYKICLQSRAQEK